MLAGGAGRTLLGPGDRMELVESMRREKRPLLFVGSMLCACLMMFGLGGLRSASAHDALVSTSPADGSSPATPPAVVTLKFSDSLLAIGAEVVIRTSGDDNWLAGEPTISGSTVTARLRPEGPSGKYTVVWRVVSSDGHPISGTFSYIVTNGASNASTSPPNSSAPNSSAPSESSTTSTDSESASAQTGNGSGGNATVAWGAGGAVLVTAAGAGFLVNRRRKQ